MNVFVAGDSRNTVLVLHSVNGLFLFVDDWRLMLLLFIVGDACRCCCCCWSAVVVVVVVVAVVVAAFAVVIVVVVVVEIVSFVKTTDGREHALKNWQLPLLSAYKKLTS